MSYWGYQNPNNPPWDLPGSSSRVAPPAEEHELNLGVEPDNQVLDYTDDSNFKQGDPPAAKKKRSRTAKLAQNLPRKRHAQGKQVALQGIMRVPIEVINEIASQATPAELIALVRTSKFFRSMLLSRSAVLVWNRAQENVKGLPPCPTGMSEPQYAAFMFSEFCTLCGGGTTLRPDRWIRVRLCPSCWDTKLELTSRDSTKYRYIATTSQTKTTKDRRRHEPARYITEELNQVVQIREHFLDTANLDGLREWQDRAFARLETQWKEAGALSRFIDAAEISREKALKSAHRDKVNDRLRLEGWEERYLDFTDSPEEQRWDSLVSIPKSLTNRIWTNLLPKLVLLLEENKCRVDARDMVRLRDERLQKVVQLVEQLREDMYPYHAVREALGLDPGLGSTHASNRRSLPNPFPAASYVASWTMLADVGHGEHTLERIVELFDERRNQVSKAVLRWQEGVERRLVEQYMRDADENKEMNTVVTVQGSTNSTSSLSPYTRFLLRADTVFIPKHQTISEWAEDKEHGPLIPASHFPTIIAGADNALTLRFDRYVRHPGVEKIVKAVLKDLGMPDAAYIELHKEGSKFMCTRCRVLLSGSWEDLLHHYHSRLRQWTGGKVLQNKRVTQHPVPFFDTHHLNSGPNDRPLARMLSHDESEASQQATPDKTGYLWCLLCCGMSWGPQGECASADLLKEHMEEEHGITGELVEDLHFTDKMSALWLQPHETVEWQEKWDAYHRALAEGGALHENPYSEPSHGPGGDPQLD